MKSLIAAVSALALIAGIGSSQARAENSSNESERGARRSHERNFEIEEEGHRGARNREAGARRGHFEMVKVRVWVPGFEKIEYVEVREPGHFECREITEIVSPARCEKIYVPPVFRIERDCSGQEIKIMVKCGFWTTREIPAVTCHKTIKVWGRRRVQAGGAPGLRPRTVRNEVRAGVGVRLRQSDGR